MNTDDNIYDGYIKTISGKKVYLQDGPLTQFDIKDIVHALENVCRFSGHVARPYSVAEHSLLVFNLLLAWGCVSVKTLMTGLLHDATEAYLPDMPTPFKAEMPEFQALEKGLWAGIAEKFDLWDSPKASPVPSLQDIEQGRAAESAIGGSLIRHADRTALFIEAKLLQPLGDCALWPEYELYGALADHWILNHKHPLPWREGISMKCEMLGVYNTLVFARILSGE